jgi:predicted acetyltransferase
MSIAVRTIDPDETAAWLTCLRTGFLTRWPVEPFALSVRSHWDYGRVWAAFEDGSIVGTARSWRTEVTVPGPTCLPATSIAAVSVLPTHRRRGILRQLMAADLAAARERGETLAVLWASDAAIYGRFGFGPATRSAIWTVDAGPGTVVGTARPGALTVTQPSVDARDAIRGVFETWRARQHGEVRRRDVAWDDALGLRPLPTGHEPWVGTLVLHRDAAGQPDGYVRYHHEEHWQRRRAAGVLHVDDLHALTDEAYRDLWRLVLATEWTATVRAETRSVNERLPWLVADARSAQPEAVTDGMWLSLLDVPAALAARSYLATGRVVLGVADADGRPIQRLLLDVTPDGAICAATDAPPDLVVDRSTLSAAYLGDMPLRHAAIARPIEERTAGAVESLERLLRTVDAPWCSTYF